MVEERQLLCAVRGIVGRVQIDGDAIRAMTQPLGMAPDHALGQKLTRTIEFLDPQPPARNAIASAAKPSRDPRWDRDPEGVCESDPRTDGPNRSRPDNRRRSRTLAAPPTRATNDRPCPLADHLEGRNSVQPPSHSADQRPSAAEPHRRNCPRADQTGQRLACEKFLGTTNTVMCYCLTLKKPLLLPQTGLVNMFVTEEASFVFRSLHLHE